MRLPRNSDMAFAVRISLSLTLSFTLSFSHVYLSPVMSLNGIPGYQHQSPELSEGLLQTFVVLPKSRRRAAAHKGLHLYITESSVLKPFKDFTLLLPLLNASSLFFMYSGFVQFQNMCTLFITVFLLQCQCIRRHKKSMSSYSSIQWKGCVLFL